jgi:hypothetical protein
MVTERGDGGTLTYPGLLENASRAERTMPATAARMMPATNNLALVLTDGS